LFTNHLSADNVSSNNSFTDNSSSIILVY
jgi:hypothetical protein